MSKLIPLKDGSIWGTGGVSSMLIFRSNSADLFLNPPHFRSDQRDPGRDPGRELGRALPSLRTILGTLRKEGALSPNRPSSENLDRLSLPEDVKGLRFPSCLALSCPATAVAGRSSKPGEALVLSNRPLGSGGALSVGSETERMAEGRRTARESLEGTARIVGRDSRRTVESDSDTGASSTIIPA
jgi:hypothetical protein